MIEFEQIQVNPGVHGKLVCNGSPSQEMEVSFQKYRKEHSFDISVCNMKTPVCSQWSNLLQEQDRQAFQQVGL